LGKGLWFVLCGCLLEDERELFERGYLVVADVRKGSGWCWI
jgi:hypothetical protein